MFHRSKAVICMLLSGVLLLSGCSATQKANRVVKLDKDVADECRDWGMTPEFAYEIEAKQPGITVDMQGYETDAVKAAVLSGSRIPDTFSIIDRNTADVVYTGTIQHKENQSGYAVFTDFNKAGTYRVQCMYLGQSYDFTIKDDLYAEHMKEALDYMADSATGEQGLLLSSEQKTVTDSCHLMVKMLQAYELYGERIQASEGGERFLTLLSTEAQWLLTMQDTSGAAYESSDSVGESIDPQEALRRTALYSGVMSKFGYAYRNEDKAFATTCLKASDRAWKYVIANKMDSGSPELFFAATELFRATGLATYRNYIKAFANAGLPDADAMDDITFYAGVTYLSTKKGVDKSICAQLMKTISAMGERISQKSREGAYLTISDNPDEILDDMEVIAVVNHIITNHEYRTVMENHLHYLLGRNPQNQDLRQKLYASPENFAGYIQLLAAVMATQ